MIYDLRNHEVPMFMTLGCRVGAGVYALFNGLWAPVVSTIALILVSEFPIREQRLAYAVTLSVFAGIFQPSAALICILILCVWTLWEFDLIGGADVKLLITTMVVTGNPAILIPIFLAGGIQGVIASMRKQKEIPFVVSAFCGSLLFILYPLIYQ